MAATAVLIFKLPVPAHLRRMLTVDRLIAEGVPRPF